MSTARMAGPGGRGGAALTSPRGALIPEKDLYPRVRRVSILYRALLLLVFLRLMAPPGICLCKSAAPVHVFLADLLGGLPPAPEPEDDDDHAPGCPASKLCEGMGLWPTAPL